MKVLIITPISILSHLHDDLRVPLRPLGVLGLERHLVLIRLELGGLGISNEM